MNATARGELRAQSPKPPSKEAHNQAVDIAREDRNVAQAFMETWRGKLSHAQSEFAKAKKNFEAKRRTYVELAEEAEKFYGK